MRIIMLRKLLTLVFITTICSSKEYRFDYTFSKLADGWLKMHIVKATWNEARLRCHAEGAVLASPLNIKLRMAIVDHVSRERGSSNGITIFTGIHASFSKGDYTSIEGVPLAKMPITWAEGEPDNFENAESCLAMLTQSNGTMGDVRCTDTYPYVCYRKTSKMLITECGTNDIGYRRNQKTGSCYKFHRRGQTWSRAYMTCAAEGGYLAIVNSETESEVLKELYAENPDHLIFSRNAEIAAIGFHDWGERGTWMTIHGETLQQAGFDRFDKGQPDNATMSRTGDTGEFCGSIFRNGNLNDFWCNVIVPFICEKHPESLNVDFDEDFMQK